MARSPCILDPTNDILNFEVGRVRKLAVVLGGIFSFLEALAHSLIFGVRVDHEAIIDISDGPNIGRSTSHQRVLHRGHVALLLEQIEVIIVLTKSPANAVLLLPILMLVSWIDTNFQVKVNLGILLLPV